MMIYVKYVYFVCFLFFCVIGAYNVHAHGSGITLVQIVGDYVVSVDYDVARGILTGSPIQFAFELFNKDRSQEVEFSDVWVVIAPVDGNEFARPILSGGIKGSTFPPSGMAFTFPSPGSYTLTLRYKKGDETLAETSFPLDVLPSEDTVGKGGFFRLTNDVFKGGFLVMVLWLIAEIGRKMLRKRQ